MIFVYTIFAPMLILLLGIMFGLPLLDPPKKPVPIPWEEREQERLLSWNEEQYATGRIDLAELDVRAGRILQGEPPVPPKPAPQRRRHPVVRRGPRYTYGRTHR